MTVFLVTYSMMDYVVEQTSYSLDKYAYRY